MELIDFHTHRETAEGVVTPRSFGIHPWRAGDEKSHSFEEFKSNYATRFEEAEIIGECGLDKACTTDWLSQRRLFEWQIRIADELAKPMVIHCVRAFNELLELRRNHKGHPWVVHGFTGSTQLAQQLFRAGILVSYGAALLDERRNKVRECLRNNPYPFLLETDDSPCGIEAVYKAAATIRKCTLQELGDTIKENYTSLMTQKATE